MSAPTDIREVTTTRPGQTRSHTGNAAYGQPLTAPETAVMVLVAQGRPNRGIARTLICSEDTVKSHLRRIFTKLGARDRAHAVTLSVLAAAIRLHPDGTATAASRPAAVAS